MRALARLGLIVAALLMRAGPPPAAEPVEIRVGALAYLGADEAEAAWAATLTQLNKALPAYRFTLVPGTRAYLTAAVAARRLDFIITNPGHYLELRIDYSATALATEQSLDGFSSAEAVGAAIVALDRRGDLQQIADLRGLKIAAVAPDAFGFRAAERELLERGVPADDFIPVFSGFPADGVFDLLRAGRADAGIVRNCLLEKWVAEGKTRANEFRVLGRRSDSPTPCATSTRLYPGWAFARLAQTSPALGEDVARALLALQPGIGDKIWNATEDYGPVEELYRTLQVGPYAPFTPLGLADLAWRQRFALALIGTAALWWIVHVVRVSQLVRRRSRELEEAHEIARLKDAQMEHAMRLSLMGEMASSLAHEINQPLAAILTYARGCERRLARGEDAIAVRDAIGRIAVQAERAGAIVRRMREFVQKNPARQVPLEPASVFRDALALFEPSAAARDLTVESDLPAELPPIRADRLQMEEVTLNLLQNALEALDGQADKKVRLTVVQEGGAIVASVSDNGPGLTSEARAKLFEAFFTTKRDGLGLGLSLSRSIIEAHGGRLSADEDARGGTTFRFYLPIIAEDAHA
jgi:two-component system, LuxR family, sensor histidine kinase TtrS